MPRLRQSRAFKDGVYFPTDDPERPIRLVFDRERFKEGKFKIAVEYLPNTPKASAAIALADWTWQNGPGGAGTTIETQASKAAGASEYGERGWLRRKGVAQPAGKVTELTLPAGAAAVTQSRFLAGAIFDDDLYLTTDGRYVVIVPGADGDETLTERDCGSGSKTTGIAVFSAGGQANLYVGDTAGGIQQWDGAVWTEGAVGTERGWLETPYWVIGAQLASGGLAGTAGTGAARLVGTNASGTGFYHVVGDPKTAANWSSLTTVTTDENPIRRTVASNHVLWFGTPSGVKGVNELGYAPNLTEWMKYTASVDNNRAMAFWNNLIWLGHEQGLVAFEPTGERVDLPHYVQFGATTATTPIFGRPRTLAPTPQGLYCAYYNGTDSYIGCLVVDPDGSYRWSMAEAIIEDEEVTFVLQVANPLTGNPKLFIGSVDDDDKLHLYTQSIPGSGDPETDLAHGGHFVPVTDWAIRLSRFNGDSPDPKTARRYILEADKLGTTYPDNTVSFQVAADGGAFTTQGTATDSPRWSAAPRESFIRATNMQVRLAVHNAVNAPVVVRMAGVYYSTHPERTRFVTYPVKFSEGLTGLDPKTTLDRLARKMREGPLQFVDHFGREVTANIESVNPVGFTEDAPGKGWIGRADLVVSIVRDSARFDSGDAFDVGQVFG